MDREWERLPREGLDPQRNCIVAVESGIQGLNLALFFKDELF